LEIQSVWENITLWDTQCHKNLMAQVLEVEFCMVQAKEVCAKG